MGKRLKKLKKIRIHREGTSELAISMILIIVLAIGLWFAFDTKIPFWISILGLGTAWMLALNFYRCPIRYFNGDTHKMVVAPADGKIVVIEEVDENVYFHDKRLLISIFMSPLNVHANWFPVDGRVEYVRHHSGRFLSAYLPKASIENERCTIGILLPNGQRIAVRQIAGAMARRIVTYAEKGENARIDRHLGFIKFGSRVDIFLPVDAMPLVGIKSPTRGGLTPIAQLKPAGEAFIAPRSEGDAPSAEAEPEKKRRHSRRSGGRREAE